MIRAGTHGRASLSERTAGPAVIATALPSDRIRRLLAPSVGGLPLQTACCAAVLRRFTGIRAVVFDFYGNQQAIAQREWQHLPDSRYPGSIDFNWQYNWPLIVECIQELLANGIQADEIAAISTTSMREGFVLYDDKGKELQIYVNKRLKKLKKSGQLKKLSLQFFEDDFVSSIK